MIKLTLVRHGESIWNKENKFTGWTDVDLSENGIIEAHNAGLLLKQNGFNFDIAYTSVLKRAQKTLDIILKELNINIPIYSSYKLNERHYGALQGLNKKETQEKYGIEQVKLWRRSVNVYPPKLLKTDYRFPGNDPKYKDIPIDKLPLTENLNDTIKRTTEYFNEEIKQNLLNGKKIIIVAHGNSLRGLIKYIDNISDEDIMNIEIPTAIPLIYEFDDNLNVIRHYYLKEVEHKL